MASSPVAVSKLFEVSTGHTDLIHDTAVDYDDRYVATASSDGSVRIFSLESKEAAEADPVVLRHHQQPVWRVAWLPPPEDARGPGCAGSYLLSASQDGCVALWHNTADGWSVKAEHRSAQPVLDIAVCGSELVFTSELDGSICALTVHVGAHPSEVLTAQPVRRLPAPALSIAAIPAAEEDEGEALLAAGLFTGEALLMRYQAGKLLDLSRVPAQQGPGEVNPVRSVSWGSDLAAPARTLAVGWEDGHVRCFALRHGGLDGECAYETALEAPLSRVCFGPTGKVLAATFGEARTEILSVYP